MKRKYIAVIQAGGKGSRMRELTQDKIPKPLLLINGKPMIEWQILQLKEYGIRNFVVITGHLGKKIEEYFMDGSKLGVSISYIRETIPLGSAGALYHVRTYAQNKDIILIFGDVMFEIEWNRFIEFHEKKNGMITLLAHPNDHPYDSDLLILDKDDMVSEIDSKKNIRDYNYKNCVNAGLAILNNRLLNQIDVEKNMDFESQLVKPFITRRQVFAYNTPEYVKDAGTPDRFKSVCRDQLNGIWKDKCLKNKQKAVFLDRDGTINVYKGFLRSADEFELIQGVAEGIKMLNKSPYLVIVITNQPVIARGECTFEELDDIHKKMETELGKEGAFLNDVLFCPHHPHNGYKGEIPELKIECDCRKPKIGMLLKAANRYNIDLSKSWFIGDTTTDIQTGVNSEMKTVLVLTGEAGKDEKFDVIPTAVKANLLEAVQYILKQEKIR